MAYTTIPKSSAYFTPKLITGNGGTQNITGLNFQPDFTWIKGRDVAENHALFDAPRGVTKRLMSDTNGAELVVQGVTAFNSDGFTLGALSAVNQNNGLFASWNWKANGAGSSNTDGTINTIKTSANTTSGVSISTYTGTGSAGTIGHGLGVAPTAIWIKKTSAGGAENWFCWNKGLTSAGGFLKLDRGDAASTNNTAFPWNPQANTFGVSTDVATNASGSTYVAYCFADVQGFSKMGSYVANGNVNGPFIYTGFKPAFVIIKADGTEAWRMVDNKRIGFNVDNRHLTPNDSVVESGSVSDIDLLSNGFKLKSAAGNYNSGSLYNYIYMAFASEPLVSTNGNAATAR
jgi:hypothetical protein